MRKIYLKKEMLTSAKNCAKNQLGRTETDRKVDRKKFYFQWFERFVLL